MDVSWAAAAKLDMLGKGTAKISLEVVDAVGSENDGLDAKARDNITATKFTHEV